jgi:hypothetical protein
MERSNAQRNGRMRGRTGGSVLYLPPPAPRRNPDRPARPLILPRLVASLRVAGMVPSPTRGEGKARAPILTRA